MVLNVVSILVLFNYNNPAAEFGFFFCQTSMPNKQIQK